MESIHFSFPSTYSITRWTFFITFLNALNIEIHWKILNMLLINIVFHSAISYLAKMDVDVFVINNWAHRHASFWSNFLCGRATTQRIFCLFFKLLIIIDIVYVYDGWIFWKLSSTKKYKNNIYNINIINGFFFFLEHV